MGCRRCWVYPLAVGLVLVLNVGAVAGEVDFDALDRSLEAVKSYEHGESREALSEVEAVVAGASADNGAAARVAERLAGLLDDPAATDDARAFVCRQLWVIGTGEQVPALAALLDNERLSHMARYAMEGIDDPAVDEALRAAAGRVEGRLLAGVLNSLGERGNEASLGVARRYLHHEDPEVAEAAALALGKIGGDEAERVIASARAEAEGSLRRVLTDAWLRVADERLEAGDADGALGVYEALYDDGEAAHVRTAGLRGIVAVHGEGALDALTPLVTGDDEHLRAAALRHMERMESGAATERLLGILAESRPDLQALALGALGSRGDSAAEDAVLGLALDERDDARRAAAVDALAGVGSEASAVVLARIAARDGRLRDAARRSLSRLRGEGVDGTIAGELGEAGPGIRAELVRALGARRAQGERETVVAVAAGDGHPAVRREAFGALAGLAEAEDVGRLVELMVEEPEGAVREAAQRAVVRAAERGGDRSAAVGPLLAARERSEGAGRAAALRVLGDIGGSRALEAVREDLRSDDEAVRDAAARALADWPDTAAEGELWELAREAENRTHRILALRGFIRLAGRQGDAEGRLERYRRALGVAERADEKRLVLAGLAEAAHPDALALAETLRGDADVEAEAEQTARRLRRVLEGE